MHMVASLLVFFAKFFSYQKRERKEKKKKFKNKKQQREEEEPSIGLACLATQYSSISSISFQHGSFMLLKFSGSGKLLLHFMLFLP